MRVSSLRTKVLSLGLLFGTVLVGLLVFVDGDRNSHAPKESPPKTATYTEIVEPIAEYGDKTIVVSNSEDEPSVELSLRRKFDANAQGVEAEEPDALFDTYEIVARCAALGGMASEEDFEITIGRLEAESVSAEVIAGMKNRYEPILADCIYVNSRREPGFWDGGMWADYLLEKAALAGSTLAQTQLLLEEGPQPGQLEKLAALLERSVRQADYRAYYQVATFYANYFQEDAASVNAPLAMQWQYLGCANDPACDLAALDESLSRELAPWELEAVRTASDGFLEKIETGESFGFENGWMPIQP